jgi:hypothetical protein
LQCTCECMPVSGCVWLRCGMWLRGNLSFIQMALGNSVIGPSAGRL